MSPVHAWGRDLPGGDPQAGRSASYQMADHVFLRDGSK